VKYLMAWLLSGALGLVGELILFAHGRHNEQEELSKADWMFFVLAGSLSVIAGPINLSLLLFTLATQAFRKDPKK
jgi:hypothetical protein